jgi:integrase
MVSDLPVGVYRKRSSLWVFFGRHGRKYHRPAHTNSIKEALAVRDQLMQEVLSGEKRNAGVGNVTCAVLLENYLQRLKRTSKPDAETYKITSATLVKHVLPFFGALKAEVLDRRQLEQYRDAKLKEIGQVSINRQLGYLRTAFKQGKRDKLTNNEPDFSTTILRSAEEENVRTGIITQAQYEKLVPSFGDNLHIQTLFVLCWNTGIRPSEAFRLDWEQVDWENRLIAVYKAQSKTGKARFLPLRAAVVDQLKRWQAFLDETFEDATWIFTHPVTGERMGKNDYRGPWSAACARAGLSGVLFYDARRAFRTYLPSEINAQDGMSVMGHTQSTTFGRYLDNQQAAKRVLEKMERPASKPTEASAIDKIRALKELSELLKDGHVTPEEFAQLKAAL